MSIPEMFRSSWLTDLSLGERGGSLESALALDDGRLCSSLKLRLLKSPTRFFGLTLTAGNVCRIKQECIPVGCTRDIYPLEGDWYQRYLLPPC